MPGCTCKFLILGLCIFYFFCDLTTTTDPAPHVTQHVANPIRFDNPEIGQTTVYYSVTVDDSYKVTRTGMKKTISVIDTSSQSLLLQEITKSVDTSQTVADTLCYPVFLTDSTVSKPDSPFSEILTPMVQFALSQVDIKDTIGEAGYAFTDLMRCLIDTEGEFCPCSNPIFLSCNRMFVEEQDTIICAEYPVLCHRKHFIEMGIYKGLDMGNELYIYSRSTGLAGKFYHIVPMNGQPIISEGWIQTWPENTVFPE